MFQHISAMLFAQIGGTGSGGHGRTIPSLIDQLGHQPKEPLQCLDRDQPQECLYTAQASTGVHLTHKQAVTG